MKHNLTYEKHSLTYDLILQARERIAPYILDTPLLKSLYLSKNDKNVYLKLECEQNIKSFKIRGAVNKILTLSNAEKQKGVAVVSSGNHGIAISYCCSLLGLKPATVVVPSNTPESKIQKIKYYGGNIVMLGSCFDEAYALGIEYIKNNNLTYIDGWDEDEIVYAGQGTVGLDIMRQNPQIDTILVPIGGGGLATASAVAAKSINPKVNVIGVCSKSCMAWPDSIKDNVVYHEYESAPSVCEAMIGGIGKLSFSLKNYLSDCIVVKEEEVKRAMLHAIFNEKIVAEAAGAVPIAAMQNYPEKIPGKNIALLISGGNANNDVIKQEILNQRY